MGPGERGVQAPRRRCSARPCERTGRGCVPSRVTLRVPVWLEAARGCGRVCVILMPHERQERLFDDSGERSPGSLSGT